MSGQDDQRDQDDEIESEEVEAYCVSCRQMTVMLNPTPVWTRRGAPGTRGECEVCGNIVFRMGRTEAHRHMEAPDVRAMRDIAGASRRRRGVQPRVAAYMNYSRADSDLARHIATDLEKTGIATWFDQDPNAVDEVQWASGVHPALVECSHMIVVLSDAAASAGSVREHWQFFREQRKPVLIAQAAECAVPDDLRRAPRFDFAVDYKQAFRALVQALSG